MKWLTALLFAATVCSPTYAAVVLLYHHISTETPASTSVSPTAFESHLEYLERHNFKVLVLSEVVDRLKRGEPLPDKTVAITFDDAYQSVHDTALPLLSKRGWPFTVFVNTEATQRDSTLYMGWGDLRRVLENGGEVQNHSHTHGYLAYPEPGEKKEDWRERVRTDVSTAQTLIEDKLGVTPTLFAYPYGEYSHDLKDIVEALDLNGIGQHSGAIGVRSDFLGLPRHPFYTGADDLDRFATRVRTVPLYIEALPTDPLRVSSTSRVTLTLTAANLESLNCFFDGTLVNIQENKLVDLGPFKKRRTKLNCTKPLRESHGAGVFAWWSYLFIKP